MNTEPPRVPWGARIEVVVISLQSAADRRARISSNLAEVPGASWRFFDALTEHSPVVGLSSSRSEQMKHFGRHLAGPEIGCFKSHFSVIQKHGFGLHQKYWMLVLEDDVWIDSDFDLDSLAGYAQANKIEYVRLFAKRYKSANMIAQMEGFRQIIRFRSDPYGAQAYLIGREGAKRFIEGLATISRPVDDELGRFWRHGLDPYCVFPFPVSERCLRSTIAPMRDGVSTAPARFNLARWIDRIGEKWRKTLYNVKYHAARLGRYAASWRQGQPGLAARREHGASRTADNDFAAAAKEFP